MVTPDTLVGAEILKRRPGVIVRRNFTSERGLTTIVVLLTDAENKLVSVIRPLVAAGRGTGLTKDSLAVCDQVRAVDRLRLITKIGDLNGPDFLAITRGLYEILDLGGAYGP